MKFIFSTGSLYSYGTARVIALAAQAGFDGIELMVDQRWDTRQPAHLLPLLEKHNLPVLAVHSPFRAVPGWPPEQPGLIRAAVQLAEAVAAPVVIHHLPARLEFAFVRMRRLQLQVPVGVRPAEQRYRQWLLSDYPQLQAETHVKLCIENMPARKWWGRRLNRHHWNCVDWASVDAITRFSSLTMDTTHLATWGLEPTEVYRRWGEQVGHIHLSNYNGREHRRPEHGQLDLTRLLRALATNHYDGAISLELHPDALGAGKPDEHVVGLMRESLRYCRSAAAAPRQQPSVPEAR